VSGANAIGVMQVIPSSGRWASALVGRPLDLFDAADNVVAGVAILAALRAAAPEQTAVAAYYQGLTSVREIGFYDDTRRYVANVLALRERYHS
jgi:soluble lytic murein transglycosylase-like protein